MSISIDLYKNTEDPKTVNKSPDLLLSDISCDPYDSVNIISPVLILDWNDTAMGANYCYISDFGRWYFINDIVITPAKKIVIKCNIDVLKTYADDIPDLTACVIRSESIGKPTYIVDNRLPVNPRVKELKSALATGGFTPAFSDSDYTVLARFVNSPFVDDIEADLSFVNGDIFQYGQWQYQLDLSLTALNRVSVNVVYLSDGHYSDTTTPRVRNGMLAYCSYQGYTDLFTIGIVQGIQGAPPAITFTLVE